VSLTQADASKFAALNPRTRVIYNASTLRATAPAETNGLQVLAVGRHVEQKGFDLLLRAWPAVLSRVPEARLRIVGDGPLRTSLTAQADALGISPTVQWIEQTKEMVDEYRSAAVFVLPSRYEGMPLALLEAQALGVPAVAFDCPTGPREVIGADTGIVVPPLSVNALAGALTSLLVQPDVRKRMALAAIERSQRLFDPQRQQEQWLTLILETAKLSEGRRQWTQTF
jgi:glycosyltransferase involved in cell wall biosynthesis